MTITTEDNIAGPYAGDGGTTAFATPYFQKDEDIRAILVTTATGAETVLTLTTQYTLTGALTPGGGTLTMVTPPAVGETLYITVDPDQTQLAIIATSNPTTQALDKLTQEVQALSLGVDRSVKVSESSRLAGAVNTTMPATTDRAYSSIGFDGSGDLELRFDGGPDLDASFTYNRTTHAGKYLLFDVDNNAVEMTLPAVTTVPNGHNFWVIVNSDLNLASITVATSGQLRSINGYAAHDKNADRVYIGLAPSEQKTAWVHVARVSNHWRVIGLLRENSTDDLSYSTATGGGGGGGAVDSVVGQTGDVSAAQIAAALNLEGDANLMTDAQETKLNSVESGATADQTDAEIETAYNNQVPQISAGEITAGTETAIRRHSPADVVALIAQHETGGGGSVATQDEGSTVNATTDTINFVGAGVTASDAGSNVTTVNIPGASGAGAYSNYIVPSGTTGANMQTAITAADSAGTGVRLEKGVAYDWSDVQPDLTGSTKLHVWAPIGTEVIIGGTALNVGDRRWRLHRSTRWEGITFKNSAICFTLEGNTGRVEETEFINCRTDNVGVLLHHELDTTPSGTMEIGTIRAWGCIMENVRDGIHCRMGSGASSTQVPVDFIDIQDCVVDDWQRYGLVIDYDGPPTSGLWPTESRAHVKNCEVRNSTTAVGAGFGYNMTAVKKAVYVDCWAVNNSRGGASFDREGFYTKNFIFEMHGGGCLEHEQQPFQGIIGLKGQDASVGDTSKLGYALLDGITLIAEAAGAEDNAIFIQRSNVTVTNCRFECNGLDFGIFACQSADEFDNIRITNNYAECDANTSGSFADLQSDGRGWIIEGNHIVCNNSGSFSAIRIRSGSVSTRNVEDVMIRHNFAVQLGAGTAVFLDIEPNAASNIEDVIMTGNHMKDFDRYIEFSGTTANAIGVHRIRNNTHAGTTPTRSGTPGGTLDETNNSF